MNPQAQVMSECPICTNVAELIFPPAGYCDHEICMSCWVNAGERNPLCPICRCDLTEWMESLKIKINSKVRFDDDENLMPDLIDGGEYSPMIFQRETATILVRILDMLSTGFPQPSRRLVYPEEPEGDEEVNQDVLRSLTGNDSYYARYDLGLLPESDFALPEFTREDAPNYSNQITIVATTPVPGEQDSHASRLNFPYYRPMRFETLLEVYRSITTPFQGGRVFQPNLADRSYQVEESVHQYLHLRIGALLGPPNIVINADFDCDETFDIESCANSDHTRVKTKRKTINMQRQRHRNTSTLKREKRSKNFHRQQSQTRRQKYKSRNNRV